ncbi:MAG TPA: hypothetical protein DCP11_16735 [Microbacteriaceae bacterium]|nr:hypothetical protein [Microbacteriaceae bacterium]
MPKLHYAGQSFVLADTETVDEFYRVMNEEINAERASGRNWAPAIHVELQNGGFLTLSVDPSVSIAFESDPIVPASQVR